MGSVSITRHTHFYSNPIHIKAASNIHPDRAQSYSTRTVASERSDTPVPHPPHTSLQHRPYPASLLSPSHDLIRMVLTPLARATEMSNVASPLLLPVNRRGSASSIHSDSPTWNASYPPPLRKNSTGSFSKLSDFRLDPEEDTEEEGNGVDGVRHVMLSVDAQ